MIIFVALRAKDGIGPERLEDLVAPSHVKPELTGQLEHEWNFLYGIYYSNWSKHDIINTI